MPPASRAKRGRAHGGDDDDEEDGFVIVSKADAGPPPKTVARTRPGDQNDDSDESEDESDEGEGEDSSDEDEDSGDSDSSESDGEIDLDAHIDDELVQIDFEFHDPHPDDFHSTRALLQASDLLDCASVDISELAELLTDQAAVGALTRAPLASIPILRAARMLLRA